MTTELILMRYSDVGITSGCGREDEEQNGGGGEAPGARGAAVAGRQEPAGGGEVGRRPAPDGVSLARRAPSRGVRGTAHDEQGWAPGPARCQGAVGLAGGLVRRPQGARLWHAAVDAQAGAAVHRAAVRRPLQRRSRLAPAGAAWVLQPEARAACTGARRGRH